ncbi:MAG: RNA polymerase sigma factor [Acidobacteria bacterium]|nr:RNA polymerase sigma factor [Acidobacteriota bacterium]
MFYRLSRQQREHFKSQALVHLDALTRTAVRMCNSRESAEDAVQETYLQAWKYWKTFQPGTNCRSWVFRILFNVIKKRAGAVKQHFSIEDIAVDNIIPFNPHWQVEAYEVLEAFEDLSEEHRSVLMLIAVEEMSYKEAAVALGVPVGTVMSRLNRARIQLRRSLGQAERKSLANTAGEKQ